MMQAAPIPGVQPFPEVLKTSLVEVEPAPQTSPPPPVLSPLQDLFSIDRLHITKRLRLKSVLCLRGKKNRFFVRAPDQSLVYTINEENRLAIPAYQILVEDAGNFLSPAIEKPCKESVHAIHTCNLKKKYDTRFASPRGILSWWVGYFCYGLRPLELAVTNNQGEEVMRIVRPYKCTARVLPCHLQRLQIYAPPGQLIGTVEQQWTPVKPLYVVKNKEGEINFWIYGPKITVSCFNDIQFRITRSDGTHVGSTCKRWQGLMHALFFAPVTDRFGVAFDIDLSVEEKALLLAATLLMDYMYYDA